jgi:hypothetical protein
MTSSDAETDPKLIIIIMTDNENEHLKPDTHPVGCSKNIKL